MSRLVSWEGVMSRVLSMPGVKVDRKEFLVSAFRRYDNSPVIAGISPSVAYPDTLLDSIADDVIRYHTKRVTALSAVAGIPGGIALVGTIPADFAQFYWHFLVLSQKLAYIYGWPDLFYGANNELSDGAREMLTMFVGVGLGVNGANAVVKEVAEQAAKVLVKKIPQMSVTQSVCSPVIKKVAATIGVRLTHDSIGKAVSKVVPVIGALVSGGLTYATFRPMALKLKKELSMHSAASRKLLVASVACS